MGALEEMHRGWAAEDARQRAAEAALRVLSGAAVLTVVGVWGLLGWPLLVGLGCGLLAAEVARTLRDRPSAADIAGHIDRVAKTHWLMQTALSIEAGTADGSATMHASVLRSAEQLAPRVAAIAVRPRVLPLPWLGLGALALASLAFRPGAPLGVSDRTVPVLAQQGDAERPTALADASADGERPLGSEDGAGVAGRAAAAADRSAAEGSQGTGGGTAQVGDGTADGQAQGGEAGDGGAGETAEEAEREGEDEDAGGEEPGGEEPTSDGVASLQESTGGDGSRETTQAPVAAEGGDGSAESDDTQAWLDKANPEPTTPTAAEGEAVEAAGASALGEPEGRQTDEATSGGEGRGAVATDGMPTIASLEDDKIWNPFTAGAGIGGINDADATEQGVAGTDRDRYNMVDAWVDSQRRASPEGRVQTTEEGRSGGRSGVAYAEAYGAYEGLAEAAVAAEALPPGRRALIQRYFDAIRPTEEEDAP